MRAAVAALEMHPAVRELYKRYLYAGRDYPAGIDVVRRRVKEFLANKDLTSEEDILRAVARGRWYYNKEFIPAIQLKKYRTMKHRYYD